MARDKFAVLSRRARKEREAISSPRLEDLLGELDEWGGDERADLYLVVEYQDSGYVELARSRDRNKLLSKVRHKVGV